jgi:hypothetical protein
MIGPPLDLLDKAAIYRIAPRKPGSGLCVNRLQRLLSRLREDLRRLEACATESSSPLSAVNASLAPM